MHNIRTNKTPVKKTTALILILILILILSGCGEQSLHGIQKTIKRGLNPGKNVEETEEPEEEAEPEIISPYYDKHIKLSVTGKGYDVFTPARGAGYDYHYGPSILLNDDGSMDAWFSSPGDGSQELDWIIYLHSDDKGETWTDEKIVLSPTPNSKDAMSVCDPDVFYYDGYYYIGYTSTIDPTGQGFCNNVFIARSENPDGPFLKWDGKGWGGPPEPLVCYDGAWNGWGVGEPSFVLLGDMLYVYTTRDACAEDASRVRSTEVRTARLDDESWPNDLKFKGYAVIRTDTPKDPGAGSTSSKYNGEEYIYSDCDSWDVAYVEEYEKFVAVCTNRRFKSGSCLLYYDSNDGVYFERISELNENVICGCHNCGILSDGSGHIKKGDPAMAGYAYAGKGGSSWGVWATRFAELSIDITDTPDRSEEELENVKDPIRRGSRRSSQDAIFITADDLVKMCYKGNSFNLGCSWVDSNRIYHRADASKVTFSGYDKNLISIEGNRVTALSAGKTFVTIEYEGLTRQICICILDPEGQNASKLVRFYSPVAKYDASLSSPYALAIRPIVTYGDYSIRELGYVEISAMNVTFVPDDASICEIRKDGQINPLSPGKTVITVSCKDGLSYRVPVIVTE